MDFGMWGGVILFGIIPTIIYIGIGLYILSLEHIKKRPGYKLPALIYFISVPSLIVIAIILSFFMNYSTGKFESSYGAKPAGYEVYKFLVLKDIIPRSGQSLDEEKTTLTSKIIEKEPVQTTKKVQFNEDILKDKTKLNFKEHGPFYGIKENGRMIRGILKGFQNKGFKTDFYGLFTKNQLMWKGYSEIKYDDGRILYQYNEYKLDKNGKVITDKDGIYQLVDSYLISKEDFAKVRKYIVYDIPIPFDLYDFQVSDTKIADVKAQDEEIKNITVSKKISNYKSLEELQNNLKIGGPDFSLNLGDFESGEKNIYSIIKKLKSTIENINDEQIKITLTQKKFFYVKKGINYSLEIESYQEFPEYKKYTLRDSQSINVLYQNIPKDFKIYQKFNNTSIVSRYFNTWMNWMLTYSKDKSYFSFFDTASGEMAWKIPLVRRKLINNEIVFDGLCKSPNEYYLKEWKGLSCNDLFKENEKITMWDIISNLPKLTYRFNNRLIAKLNLEIDKKYDTDEKYYALVIGNNDYEYLEKLDAAENDAVVIADVLTNKYGFEVELLLNADYDTTVNSLYNITNKLKSNDNLLIYYAGHGELEKAENRGYWLPVDASYELRSKWISNQRIVDRIKATKAKHVLLIADSCFSGTLMRSGITPEANEAIDAKYIERLKRKKTRLVITSGGNEPVVDSDGGDHSLFASKLIDTLKNNNNVINSQMLFENVRRYVVSNADQTPERAQVHKTGHDGGDFLFFPKN
jgi:hypothetical protein